MADYNEVIAPLPYFGNITWYRHLLQDDMIVDSHENYVKQTLRNRCELACSQGRYALTVPVQHSLGKSSSGDILISYQSDWRGNHRKSIRSAYGAAPFFIHYWDELSAIWDQEPKTLMELNLMAHQCISELLDLPLSLALSESYVRDTPGIDLRQRFKRGQLDNPRYIQVFEEKVGFQADLSILDLLFCKGPQSSDYLRSIR